MIVLPEQYVVQIFYQNVSHPSYNKITKTYNGSCPFCKEGKSFGKKRRFFYIPKNNNVFCHNCGYNKPPFAFVSEITNKPFNVIIDEISASDYDELPLPIPEEKEDENQSKSLPDDCINLSDKTQIDFYAGNAIVDIALNFIKRRRLDTAINRPKTFYLSLVDKTHKNRLLLPFYDVFGNIIYYQSRTLLDTDNFKKPKYLSKIGGNKSLYGIHSVSDLVENIYILEGPIDSFFVKNGLALCGIQDESDKLYTELQQQQITSLSTYNKVWVLDNQRNDKASLKKTEILLNADEQVFIWPEDLKGFKDVNDYCIANKLDEFPQKIILDNLYQGLEGLLVLEMIKNS